MPGLGGLKIAQPAISKVAERLMSAEIRNMMYLIAKIGLDLAFYADKIAAEFVLRSNFRYTPAELAMGVSYIVHDIKGIHSLYRL
jgi:hypothetical protein